MKIFFFTLAIGLYIIYKYIRIYNQLITFQQKTKESWSGVNVQIKRRYDLIPNIVETVKGYTKHEQETLKKVISIRSVAMNNNGHPTSQARDENSLSKALKSIFALSENYPELKANKNFIKLQEELGETEDQIAASRRIYNGNVSHLNTMTLKIPSNIIALIHGIKAANFFKINESEKVLTEIEL